MDEYCARLLSHGKKIKERYDELTELTAAPEITADSRYWRRLIAERTDIEETAACYAELKEELTYPQGRDAEITVLAERLNMLLLARKEGDERNAVVELRALDGKDSGQAAYYLYETYRKYAALCGFTVEDGDAEYTDKAKIKGASFTVSGYGAYRRFRYESGLHKTVFAKKSEGVTKVSVFPEALETEVSLSDKDVRIDIYRSGGKGGQNVNKVETAVRVTHIPSGLSAACQDERSQLQNKERAFKILRAKLLAQAEEQKNKTLAAQKKEQTAERIRTYDFMSGVATDCRTNLNLEIQSMANGNLKAFTDALLWQENDKNNRR